MTDADGDPVRVTSLSVAAHVQVNALTGNQLSFIPAADFAGTTTLTYQVTDGQTTAGGTVTIRITDNDLPDTTIYSGPTGTTTDTGARINFSGTDNIGVVSYEGRLDGAAFAPVTSPVVLTGLAPGPHTYDVRAVDAAGNVDASPAGLSWTVVAVDNTAPTLTLPQDFTVEATSPAGALVTYTAGASDSGSGVASSSFTPPSGSWFPLGVTVVQASATDVAGNPSTGSFRVTVQDTSPPVLLLHGASPLNVPLHGAYQDPGAAATDAVEGAVAVTVTGTVDVNTPGNYTINYHATDSTGHGATAQRTVVVGTGALIPADDFYFTGSAQRTPMELPVLDNDTSLHPALLTVASVTRPLYGSAVVAAGGKSIVYTPAISYAKFAERSRLAIPCAMNTAPRPRPG